jgi:hypothetical protein
MFEPQRFLNNKAMYHSSSYRPFGGGNTICPGRNLARKSIYTFTAILLGRYDVSLAETVEFMAGKQSFPRIDDTKPGLGALAPVHGDDVILILKKKPNSNV